MARRIGLKYSENLYGTYTRAQERGEERRFVFHVDAATDDLWATLRHGEVSITGDVEADGLAGHARLQGRMIVKPLLARMIRYEFEFTGDDGAVYHYAGQKEIRHLQPVRTWTTLPGTIRDAAGNEVATCLSYFKLHELLPFLRSFKPMLHAAERHA